MNDLLREATLPIPEHGWTCFFCGETFTTIGAARDHFGNEPFADTACRIKVGEERGLVMALRRAEKELARYRAEDSDADREFHRMRAEHATALRREEEKGYERGLRDGRTAALASEPRPDALEEMRKALEPFAKVVAHYDYYIPDALPTSDDLTFPKFKPRFLDTGDGPASVTLHEEDFRRAALALATQPLTRGGGE